MRTCLTAKNAAKPAAQPVALQSAAPPSARRLAATFDPANTHIAMPAPMNRPAFARLRCAHPGCASVRSTASTKSGLLATNARYFYLLAILLASAGLAKSQTLPTFHNQEICRAAIGLAFGRDPRIIKIDRQGGRTLFLHYNRPGDGKYWDYRCKVDGNRILWSDVTGRWRDQASDGILLYTISSLGLAITQKYPDGSASTQTYTKAQLGK